MKDAEAQAAVDALAEELGHSVLVEDHRLQPLWWSVQHEIDGARARSILQRMVDPAAMAVVNKLRISRATEPFRFPEVPEADMRARWCVPVRSDDELLGYIWILDSEGAVGEEEAPRMMSCAAIVAEAIKYRRAEADTHGREVDSLIERLLVGPDEDAAAALIKIERLSEDATVSVFAPAIDGGWRLPEDMSAHVVRAGEDPATSGAPLPLADLSVAVGRARITRRVIRAGAVLDEPTWEALGTWKLIAEAPDDLSVADIHPGAEKLSALPNLDLMTTARVVLERGGDLTAAASQLHIHRTTLYYRLDRIQAITGADLRVGADRLDLHLALRLAAYRSTADP
jgi:hypothetical protein